MNYVYGLVLEGETFPLVGMDDYESPPIQEQEKYYPGSKIVVRPVLEWRNWTNPDIYKVSEEEANKMDFVTGILSNGYLRHAWKVNEVIKGSLVKNGWNSIHRDSKIGSPVCGNTKQYYWMKHVRFEPTNITELTNERRETYLGTQNTVCVDCQNTVASSRKGK